MFQKLTYLVFLFLQLFMITTSFSNEAWLITEDLAEKKLSYDLKTSVDHKEAYVLKTDKFRYGSVIYLVGDHSTSRRKVKAGTLAAKILRDLYKELTRGPNLYFHRRTFDSTINSFDDILKWEYVCKEIPRLYSVSSNGISQIPLKTNLQEHGKAFVLHNESEIIVYYSPLLDENIRKKAAAFASYIRDFEKEKHNVDTSLCTLHGQIDLDVALNRFIERINEIIKTRSEIEINSIQENDVEDSRTINIAYDKDDAEFEMIKERVYETLKELCSLRSSTEDNTVSTSSDSTSTEKTNKASKRKTKGKGNKNKPFIESESSNVVTTAATSTASTYVFESTTLIFCKKKYNLNADKFMPFCVYVILDVTNLESIIYFGRGREISAYTMAIMTVEVFLDKHPSANVSYIADDGNLLPPYFIIYFNAELERILSQYLPQKHRF